MHTYVPKLMLREMYAHCRNSHARSNYIASNLQNSQVEVAQYACRPSKSVLSR